jgi:putative ABC transport system permease protein
MGTLLQDVRYAARHLRRSPLFTLGAVALLAIGIGANTTAFTVVDGLLFRPPPWSAPEEVVHVYQDSDDGEPSSSSFPATRDMAGSEVFRALAATTPSSATWEGPDGLERVATEYTTSAYMDVLGRSVQRGRWFEPENDVVGGAPLAVVSAATWRARFGSDPDVVGRTIRLNGQPVTIVGVGPEGLTSTVTPLRTDFWLSISATPVGGAFQVANLERREDHWYMVVARLAPEKTVQQAQSAMDALAARLAEEYPELNRGRGITVFASKDVRMHPEGDGQLFLAGGLLSAVVLTILLLACANLANLLLVRGLGRSGETAVRTALGAPRGRVARLFLLESLLLALAGGALGLLFTRWALAAVPMLPLADVVGGNLEVGIDGRVAAFSLALVGLTGVLFGLAPAVRSVRTDVAQVLRDDRRGTSAGRGTMRLRGLLVGVQVAASLVLVLGTGLIARSLTMLQTVDPGVDPDRVAYLRVDWSRAGLEGEQVRATLDELRARMAAIPGVTEVAMASRLPAERSGTTTTEVEGYTPPAGTNAVELPFAVVTDGYLEAMGIPVVAGRSFGDDDVPGEDGVSILVTEAAARRFWGDADPIGRRMRGQGSERWARTVVGVVGNAPVSRLGEVAQPMFYYTTRQTSFAPSYVVVRSDGDPAALLAPMRRTLAEVSPSAVVSRQGTLASHFGGTLATPRMAARAMGAFSALALLLAGLGIYAVVSFSVARRTSELGIRMALGAERSGVVRMVVREVAGVVIAGLLVGLVVSALAASRLGGLLYGVEGLDPVSFGGAVLVLLAVAWAAAYVPARRASRADPVEALRVP